MRTENQTERKRRAKPTVSRIEVLDALREAQAHRMVLAGESGNHVEKEIHYQAAKAYRDARAMILGGAELERE